MTGLLVVETRPGRVELWTQVVYNTLRGRVLWTQLSKVHRRLALGLLTDAETAIVGTV